MHCKNVCVGIIPITKKDLQGKNADWKVVYFEEFEKLIGNGKVHGLADSEHSN
jgi:hypothetical protein